MNRKLLSTVVIFLAAVMAAPLAQARDGRGDHRPGPGYREMHVERHYSHPGPHRGWYKPRHFNHHRHHYYNHYRGPAPRYYGPRHHHPGYYRSSSAPIILGSVIGGVVGHEIGYGDPGHTAAGAVVGTVIGYEIARHR